MEDSIILEMRSYLDGLANGRGRSQLEELILSGLKIIHLEKGILRCKYFITERVSDEVEIEGKVTGTKGNLKQVIIEIRRKGNRHVIARGSLWMVPLGLGLGLKDLPPPLGKSNL